MPVKLPNVTVVIIDAVAHDLARLAISDTLNEIDPAEVLIWSDRPICDCVTIFSNPQSTIDAMRLLWYNVPPKIKTSHFLCIQWDGWVLDGTQWNPEWLDTDFIGAPWPWHRDGLTVGNGGFSLRSTDLARWVAANPGRYPLSHHLEDDVLCRIHRPALERDGFVWGSRAAAEAFSFEHEEPRPAFGYHGAWNWPRVLTPERLAERVGRANDYVRGKSEWRELMAII